ncbi:response regulator [Vreelandella rituensis]|uniref:Chemotaxis protein CheA n=1 Tax=Vreelandella rituensis TaxID=2282306 RepID=A0A368U0N5_9GAMM|nr:response regulator [Halomonas rituensis]RCV89622.1 hybrid sensor histidine kinase/response regulator [Halomonas rituensis]
MALDIQRFIQRFIEEALDHLGRMAEGIAALERDRANTERINELFRSAHTMKGSSRMLKLTPITATAHSLEELLSALREGQQSAGPEIIGLLYQGMDALSDLVGLLADGSAPEALPAANPALCQALEAAASGQDNPCASSTPLPADVSTATLSPTAEPSPTATPAAEEPGEMRLNDSVRVRLERLDEVIRLMGEVLSGHTHMHHLAGWARRFAGNTQAPDQSELAAFSRELREGVLTQEALMVELHDRALQMRMLPLNIVFDPLSRLARDMARSLGKQVDCRVRGSEIELDRQMIDHLSDPLVHLLRNALDHGIEPPEVRLAAGKPARGQLTLEAWQDGGWVMIEVSDDGAGIALAALREKALHKQLLSREQLDALSERETQELIFRPGFSTSALITDFSGRGVGMDVVKRSVVDTLSGDLQLTSRPGQGTCFTLRLPLSLAMMRVLLFQAGGLTLGVTAQYVVELVELPASRFIATAGGWALTLYNEFIPVIALAELLGLPSTAVATSDAPSEARDPGRLLLVVHQGHEKLALIIDALVEEGDRVIKPLPKHLRSLPLISGMVTHQRNDLVSLLHVPALLERMRQTSMPSTQKAPSTRAHRVLVVDDSLNTREIEKDVLEAWGYHVTLAENGEDGLQKALAESFDAILTDVEMPRMDGFALTARLREEHAYRHCPIIIITSREKETDRRRGLDVGADAYIVKGSFDQNILVDTLKALLG